MASREFFWIPWRTCFHAGLRGLVETGLGLMGDSGFFRIFSIFGMRRGRGPGGGGVFLLVGSGAESYEWGVKTFLLLLALGALTGCNSPERYEANRQAAQGWLSAKAGSTKANASGKWTDATSDGWGDANLVQRGNRITGTLGNYEVDGVANGSQVFLALHSDRWYYYSVEAVNSGSVMRGRYAKGFPVNPKKSGDQFEFRRVR
jgi:hypothetical protein